MSMKLEYINTLKLKWRYGLLIVKTVSCVLRRNGTQHNINGSSRSEIKLSGACLLKVEKSMKLEYYL